MKLLIMLALFTSSLGFASTKSFLELRQTKAIENRTHNMLAANYFSEKNDSDMQANNDVAKKSLRFQLDDEGQITSENL